MKNSFRKNILNYRLNMVLLIAALASLSLSCRSESLFTRLGENYLPYDQINSNWVFRVTGEDTLTVEWTVRSREPFNGRVASLIESTEGDFFYSVESNALLEFVTHTVFAFGEDLVLEERWRSRIEAPLNIGNHWEETFVNQVENQGLTYSIESSLTGHVEDVETVFTPVDFFDECYRVRIEIRTKTTFPAGKTEEEITRIREWYAPGVGMIKREIDGGDTWELTDFLVL